MPFSEQSENAAALQNEYLKSTIAIEGGYGKEVSVAAWISSEACGKKEEDIKGITCLGTGSFGSGRIKRQDEPAKLPHGCHRLEDVL